MAKLAIVLLCVLTGVAALPRGASAEVEAFPFAIPWDDAAGTAIDASGSLVLTAIDKVENTGLRWSGQRTFAANSWSQGPTIAETVRAAITIPTSARTAVVHALDETGARSKAVPSTLSAGGLTFHIGPQDKALWYEISAGRGQAG